MILKITALLLGLASAGPAFADEFTLSLAEAGRYFEAMERSAYFLLCGPSPAAGPPKCLKISENNACQDFIKLHSAKCRAAFLKKYTGALKGDGDDMSKDGGACLRRDVARAAKESNLWHSHEACAALLAELEKVK